MKVIQELLGHSDFSTTANIYAPLDYNSKLSSAYAVVNGLKRALIGPIKQKRQLLGGENCMKTDIWSDCTKRKQKCLEYDIIEVAGAEL